MIGVNRQSVLSGVDSLSPRINVNYPVNTVTLANGVFDYINVVRTIRDDLPTEIPLEWDGTTIMDCTFNTLNGGNMEYAADNISKILVQRKRVDIPYNESTWTTLYEVAIEDQTNLNFIFKDVTNVYGATYQYQLVPIAVQRQGDKDIEIEGTGQPSQDVISSFDGVFICDANTFVKIYAGVEYGSLQTTQLTGVHETLDGKYPIIVSNSSVNYHSGSITGTILNTDYGKKNEDGTYTQLDRIKIVKARQELDKFLTNKTPKIIKDDNGNIWLVIFVDDIDYSFFNEWGRGLGDMSADWVEIGDATLGADLKRTGIINTGGV